MSGIRVSKDTRFLLDQQLHVVEAVLPGNKYRVLNMSTNHSYTIAYDEIAKAHSEMRLKFEIFGRNARKNAHEALNTKFLYSDLDDIKNQKAKEATWRRYKLLLELYEFHREERLITLTRKQISEFVAAKISNGPLNAEGESIGGQSVASIERYMKDFIAGDGSILALIPNIESQGAPGKSRLHPEVESIIQSVLDKFVAITERVKSFDHLMANVINAIGETNKYRQVTDQLEFPDETTIRDRIDQRGRNLVLGRKPSAREAQKGFTKAIQQPPERIGEIYEIDSAQLPFFVVDEENRLVLGRPRICTVTDRCSRLPVGWAMKFGKEGYELIRMAVRHAFLPKPDYKTLYGTQNNFDNVFGIPEKIRTDQGKDYKGKNFQSVALTLRFRLERLPKRMPWFKGSMERFYKSQNQGALSGHPGYAFENIIAKGDYDPVADAVISLEALRKILIIWIVDVFTQRWHTGLKGIPMERWYQDWNNGLMLPLHHNSQDIHYGLLPFDERLLGPRVLWENMSFGGENLAYLREIYGTKEAVKFHHDPDNVMYIYFKDLHSDNWLPLINLEPWYAEGLTFYQHELNVAKLNAEKKQVNIENLAKAKEQIQQTVLSEFNITRSITRRGKIYGTFTDMIQNPPKSDTPPAQPASPDSSESSADFRRPGSIED